MTEMREKHIPINRLGHAIQEMVKRHTPAKGNRCKALRCDGKVVSHVTGTNRGGGFYDTPKCNKCGRYYLYAEKTRRVGLEELRKRMLIPVVI